MTVQNSYLSDIGYHLYTIFLFTKNDILTAIIPVVSTVLTSLRPCSLHNLTPDIVFYRLCAAMQPHPHLAYHLLDLAPYPTVRPREPDQGARGRQGEQTIPTDSSGEDHRTRCDNPPVPHCPALPGVFLAV